MENINYGFDQRAQIISELLQGLEYAKQLQDQITNKITSFNDDNHALNYISLIETMLSTFNKTIKIAKQITNNNILLELTHSSMSNASPSPRSEICENSQPDKHRATKRRKMMPKWTKMVEISQDTTISGLEGPLSDGFSWRKYGQKEILGAKFPRGYYRCTHRHNKGCLATKQVQQSNDDPFIYQVIYKGEHSCYFGPTPEQAHIRPTMAQPKKPDSKPILNPQQQAPINQPVIQEVYLGLGPEGELQIEPNEFATKAQIFRCFSFKSCLVETEPLDFASPTTSDSSYFPVSSYENSGLHPGLNVQISESDIYDSISGQNSVTNSPTMMTDFEFPLEQWLDLDPNLF